MLRRAILATLIFSLIPYILADNIRGIDIDFVTIGNPGNPQDTISGKDNFGSPINSPYGAVGYEYRIGKYEITNAQWNQFVTIAGAPQIGTTGTFFSGDQLPTTGVSWYEAAQFCNWLTSGNKNQGPYTNYAIDRTSAIATYGTIYVLPTEDEWYKAAYYKHDASGYSVFANGTNTVPSGNYGNTTNPFPWNVGVSAEEQNGTYDMMGNVWEWNETWMQVNWDQFPIYRGGSFESPAFQLASYHRNHDNPFHEGPTVGFRIVAITPEPASLLLLGLGGLLTRKR